MNALRVTIAVGILALAGCNILEEELREIEGGGSATGGQGVGGAGPGTGGAVATGGVAGGTGGAVATGGVAGGTGGAAGATPPACAPTAVKGSACAGTDPQVCARTCGPESVGFKTETCAAGVYVESSCQFAPTLDYSCYKIPAADSPQCPSMLIQAGTPCTIPDCVVCGGSLGGFLDATGAMKNGFCVCPAASANPTWSCAAITAWPCPSGNGC